MSDERTCKGCGKTKPVDDFQKTGKLYKDGTPKYNGKCKLCMNGYQREYRAANPDKKEKYQALNRAWVESNKDKVNEYQREYAKLHPEKAKASRKKWREANPDKVKKLNESKESRAACRRWREANKDKISADNTRWREQNPTYIEEWKKLHPEYKVAKRDHNRKRKIREKGAEGSHTLAEWEALLLATGNKCLRCGAVEKLTRDHIIPITKGGTDNISNIQPLCHSCNSQKSTKTVSYR